MSTRKRLTEVFKAASKEPIPFDDTSKFVFFSDVHRGTMDASDEFARNKNLFTHALRRYFDEQFTYVEVGDGDELLENKRFEDIAEAHDEVFALMGEFYADKRLHMIWGNHDMVRKKPKIVKKQLWQIFDGIILTEGLVLKHSDYKKMIFVVHGHQGRFFDEHLWGLSKFAVRHVWKGLQLLGLKDSTRPAKNNKKRAKIEKKILEWIEDKKQPVICGHTHRPSLPAPGGPGYFNIGSCVHPYSITCIELVNSKLSLIKWKKIVSDDGVFRVEREVLGGPLAL